MTNFLKIACRSAFGADLTPLTYKAFVTRFEYVDGFYKKKLRICSWLIDRCLLFGRVVTAPWVMLFSGMNRDPSGILVVDPSADHRLYLEFYLAHNFGEKGAFLGQGYPVPLPPKIPWRDYLSHYGRCISASILAFFDFSHRRYRLLHRFFYDSLLLTLCGEGRKRVYVFHLIDPNYYLFAGFCRYRRNMNVAANLSIMAISSRISRYFDIDCTVLMGTHVQEEEVRYLQEIGDFRAARIVYTGSEYIKDFVSLQRTAPSIDIGFFSSGEWARDDGRYRVSDISRIRGGEFITNKSSAVMMDVLRALAELSRQKNLRLRIYLHPYERTLLSQYGISPPFASLIDDRLIDMDSSRESSRMKIFEPFAGVSLQSSIIWQRLDMDLRESFICNYEDASRNTYIPESLGIYRHCLYTSPEELVAKIEVAMKARSPEAVP